MRKLLSAVVLAMSVMVMSVQGCGDSQLPAPAPAILEIPPVTYYIGTWDLIKAGPNALPVYAIPDQILSETYVINADKSFTWSRLRQTHDSSTTPIGSKQQTLTNTGTWVEISGMVNGIRLSGTYANTLINPPRAAGLPYQYDVTPQVAKDVIQVRVNGQYWDYLKRK